MLIKEAVKDYYFFGMLVDTKKLMKRVPDYLRNELGLPVSGSHEKENEPLLFDRHNYYFNLLENEEPSLMNGLNKGRNIKENRLESTHLLSKFNERSMSARKMKQRNFKTKTKTLDTKEKMYNMEKAKRYERQQEYERKKKNGLLGFFKFLGCFGVDS
jgi:hypothetical protein